MRVTKGLGVATLHEILSAMRLRFLIFFLCLSAWSWHTRAIPLTFRVDMRGQVLSADGIHVAGTFQRLAGFAADWDPGSTEMTDANADSIYEALVDVPPGLYYFKFINGTTWATSELVPTDCGENDGGGNINRKVSLGNTALRLPAIPFRGCLPTVRFSVNMQGLTVPATGVHVMGNFQRLAGYATDWNPSATPLQDPDQDGIYQTEVVLPAGATFFYRFVSGNTTPQAEVLVGTCPTADGIGGTSRVGNATGVSNIMPRACFATCGNCGNVAYNVPWWNDCVFYEIFVRSFYDSNGDGIGDFSGLLTKLDYLNDGNPATDTDLGITGIWLMPINPSPSYHGYDVTDYKSINAQYGSMADFDAFLAGARARGIKVIIDLVLNHSSSVHPWFTQSASGVNNPFRNWYVWASARPSWGQWVQRGGAYYYTVFGGQMPDLNWRSAPMRSAIYDACRYWLHKGVDGYRLDAVKFLIEDTGITEGASATFDALSQLRDTLIAAKPTAYTVGEVWSSTQQIVPYVQNNRLNTCFDFHLGYALLDGLRQGTAVALRDQLQIVNASYPRLQYATFLTNHDQNRVIDALGGNMAQMKQAATLYLTMPGVPFLYYGEEVAMQGSGLDEDKRRPMQWTSSINAGFTTGRPWRTINSNYRQFNVATQQADSTSLLVHYKRLIALRNRYDVLRRGYFVPATTGTDAVLGYGRIYNGQAVFVVSNFGASAVRDARLSVSMTTLSPGIYTVKELFSGQTAGTVTIDAQGGLAAWSPGLGALGPNQTWILHIDQNLTSAQTPILRPKLKIYPNPADDEVTIELPAGSELGCISVYTVSGKPMYEATCSESSLRLNSNPWPTGTYFVRYRAGESQTTAHLVVSHD